MLFVPFDANMDEHELQAQICVVTFGPGLLRLIASF
jgi:hypothetical protein